MKTLFYKALITLVLVISAITWQENMMDGSGFEKMGKPKPGEWLFHFHEIGQSVEDYIGAHPVRATGSGPGPSAGVCGWRPASFSWGLAGAEKLSEKGHSH